MEGDVVVRLCFDRGFGSVIGKGCVTYASSPLGIVVNKSG